MISKTDLRRLARARLKDSEVLFEKGRYDGALYLCGYAIELALKARICRTLKWTDFPSSNKEFEPFKSLRTHNLDTLLSLSGLEDKIKIGYLTQWSVVATWDPEARDKSISTVKRRDALNMLESGKNAFKGFMRTETVNKFIALEKKIAKEKGKFVLFALFERAESKNKWDVVVSAPWLGDSVSRWDYLIRRISSELDPIELNKLSRIVVLEATDDVVRRVNNSLQVEHKNLEVRDFDFLGLVIEHAHIITSNPSASSAPKQRTHHVVPDADVGWLVKKGGAERASRIFDNKQDAIEYAREVSRNQYTNLIIHGKNGKIQRVETP
jgi:hypothetical protein